MNIYKYVKPKQEEEKLTFSSNGDIARYIVEKMHTKESDKMSDADKNKMSSNIDNKLRAGKKLSKKEEQYLKETNPKLYMEYQRIQAKAKALEEQLKHAKTKQEVNNIISASVASVSDKDPSKQYIIAAIHNVADNFKSSRAYQKLPATSADLKKYKSDEGSDYKNPDEENEDFDPMSWSPLQEVIDSMPSFDMPA